jgi:hypothetical protein
MVGAAYEEIISRPRRNARGHAIEHGITVDYDGTDGALGIDYIYVPYVCDAGGVRVREQKIPCVGIPGMST